MHLENRQGEFLFNANYKWSGVLSECSNRAKHLNEEYSYKQQLCGQAC